jgi:Domain of unknown function DUF11
MKNLLSVHLGMLFALATVVFLCASIASAANVDLAVTAHASVSNANVGDLVTFTGTLTNKGPDAGGDDTLYIDDYEGVSIRRVSCDIVSPDGNFCEYGSLPVGQSAKMRVVTKVVDGAAGQFAWLLFCSTTLGQANDPVGHNDCAVKVIRVP